VTRLVEEDVRALTAHLDEVERRLVALTGCDFVALAARACGVAVVPITSGEGVIPGFVQCVAAICARLGCRARVTQATDVAGFGEALAAGDDVVFAADDRTFLAFDLARRVVADDDPCTAHAYVAALDAAAGPGGLAGRPVLLVGLGPVGRAAASRLVALGADVLVCEREEARLAAVVADLPQVTPVTLADGLERSRLVLDATPTPGLVDAGWVGADGVVSAPGLPPGVTAAAARALGERLVHEPLALGVAAMAVEALTRCGRPFVCRARRRLPGGRLAGLAHRRDV
jgi:pyrrolysine biosynthesis protein PylD